MDSKHRIKHSTFKENKSVKAIVFIALGIFAMGMWSCEKDCDKCNEVCICQQDTSEQIHIIDLSEVEIVRVYQTQTEISIEIDDEELDLVNEYGLVWSKTEQPILQTNVEGLLVIDSVVEDFVALMTDLEPGTDYYFKAYAQTKDSLFYSLQQKLTTIQANGTMDSVQDVEGRIYRTKIIGGNEWMIDNLKTTHFSDGSPIETDISDQQWGSIKTPAYGIYAHEKIDGFESDSAILEVYGALYNWYAIADERGLCPEGWHVSTDEEWRELEMALGMSQSASLDTDFRGSDEGAKIKISTSYPFPHPRWDDGNESNNISGFSVIPGGGRYENGNYGYKGFFGYIWTSTEVAIDDAWSRSLAYYETKIGRNITDKNMGMNVRCIRDDH